ncbi:hypothetical protein [Ovoidimarina sediminis]|uniref:hypothetical protein n=1 Tax=Ovoidimarina sediminis TaxID=3079856 RepID=UPI0029098FA2|nr:hypothetical protein [Rhodophyticola sp. MJ-SS7]MDU8943758.1 hypothetical protein [Rhodophyticola sp. MJ-SS7]
MKRKEHPFFVGYLPVPSGLRIFLAVTVAGLIVAGGALAYWIGTTQDDPGTAALRFDYGRQTVSGVIELTPLPILHVTEGNERIPAGRTLMMSGQGKNGVMERPGAVHGQLVEVSGVILERGTMDMLQLRGGNNGMKTLDGTGEVPVAEDLGRWKLAGEICDGKCLAGAMRPGRGLAHKACANLCILGGVPPVFVSSQPVEGTEFLMIAGPDGSDLPEEIYDLMALYIQIEGRITRHGDLLVFAMEPETAVVLP